MTSLSTTRFLLTAVTLAIISAAAATAHATLNDDVVGELNAMQSLYNTEYAPREWKQKYTSYNLATEYGKAVAAVQANPQLTIKDARTIFKNFIYAMKDYHTSISFVSTEKATLPLMVRSTDTQMFIAYIDRTKLTEAAFPYNVGDEIVNFGGEPAVQALSEVQAQIPANIPATDKAIAEVRFTSRSGASGIDVPNGPVSLDIRRQGETSVSTIQMIWEYTPERIAARGDLMSVGVPDFLAPNKPAIALPQMSAKLFDSTDTDTPLDIGGKKAFTPDLGTKIWESTDDNTFYAYIFQNADHKLIGYVRIPQYEADSYSKAVTDFAAIITKFQTDTDSMVIDQVNNPGGSVFYMYALISMLSDQPMQTPLHRMSINQADVNDALNTIATLAAVKTDADAQKAISSDDLNGYPSSYEFVQFAINYSKFIVSEWNAGRKLTNPSWISGVDHINPAATHYTKPILLLINHLDFSGGDFFPTIMQDNKRVTVMGSRTAGAGGYVADIPLPNNVGVANFRCTESIAERVSGNPIENLGVTPDVAYEMTADDYMQNYAPYAKAIQAAVKSITP